jgi:hypothetical protein
LVFIPNEVRDPFHSAIFPKLNFCHPDRSVAERSDNAFGGFGFVIGFGFGFDFALALAFAAAVHLQETRHPFFS